MWCHTVLHLDCVSTTFFPTRILPLHRTPDWGTHPDAGHTLATPTDSSHSLRGSCHVSRQASGTISSIWALCHSLKRRRAPNSWIASLRVEGGREGGREREGEGGRRREKQQIQPAVDFPQVLLLYNNYYSYSTSLFWEHCCKFSCTLKNLIILFKRWPSFDSCLASSIRDNQQVHLGHGTMSTNPRAFRDSWSLWFGALEVLLFIAPCRSNSSCPNWSYYSKLRLLYCNYNTLIDAHPEIKFNSNMIRACRLFLATCTLFWQSQWWVTFDVADE